MKWTVFELNREFQEKSRKYKKLNLVKNNKYRYLHIIFLAKLSDLVTDLAVTMNPPKTLMKEMKAAPAARPSIVLVG